MAIGGSPVGNMVIKVDLDSAGVEKSMTGLQRQLKSSNKAMGAQLSAFDRGDKSAAKYGVMIEGLSNRHRIQARMVDEARLKYQNMSKEYGENSVKAQQAAQQLNEQIARYQETGRELDNVTAEFQEFQRVQEIQSKGWYKVADGMDKYGGKLKTAGAHMDDTGKKMTRGVTVPLSIVGGLAVKTGSDFEAGMSKVGAVSGASAEEMGQLEAKAREMGKTTVFSAKETSDAFYYMSLAGWDASDMMDGISGVMDLAAASGEDLAQVSDIVTDGLTAFGLSAKESGRMADVLAAASANANTDVSGLGAAFSYVAPVAGALGYTIEDTSKAIGLMSNSGIKAQKAGTALRKMMNSLAKPTSEAQKLMDKYGISLTDSEGNMKSFDKVMLDLRKGLGNLSEEQQAQAAATIFGQEAMSGALAIVNASEEDYKKLTDSIEGSEGAASDMAKTMQDNLQGSLKELKSMLEDLFIEMYQNLKPALESVIDGAKDLTEWFANLSPKTQENVVKFGLLAAAMGPVLSVTGKLTMGVGGLMQGAGALTKTIGLSKGVGLLGSLGALGPAAIGGVAVAGLAAVATGAYHLMKDSEKLEEVTTDVAHSLNDQAAELENSAEVFDKLSGKAKISNEQLAELNDLNIRISESSNPGEIDELQKRYNDLARESGLSKDELKELFGANKNLIDQTPEIKTSISDQGNEFAKNTDAVKEYIATLHEATLIELEGEREKNLKNQEKIQKNINDLNKEHNEYQERISGLVEAENMTQEERKDRMQEIRGILQNQVLDTEEELKLGHELNGLKDVQQGKYSKVFDELTKSSQETREQLQTEEEKLQKIEAFDEEYQNILLSQVGITEEGEKGLAQLDKSIAKNQEELAELDKKLEKNGHLTKEEQERYDQLHETTEKQREIKGIINDELGLYKDINSLANGKLDSLDKEQQKNIENIAQKAELKNTEKDIVKELEKKNGKLVEERKSLEENREKQGANKKEIDKQITSINEKISKNASVKKQILDELGIWDDLDQKIKDGINSEIKKGKAVDDTKGKVDNQGRSIDENNRKTDIGIEKEQERSAEAGRDVDKKVDVKDYGTVAILNKRASERKDKRINVADYGTIAKLNRSATETKSKKVDLTDGGSLESLNTRITNPITKTVNLVAKGASTIRNWFADGTPKGGHPGGHAVLGDGKGSNAGRELVTLPSGKSFLSAENPTLYPNLPKGTSVISAKETKKVMKSIPRYAQGTSDLFSYSNLRNNEFMKLLALNQRDNNTKSEIVFRNERTQNNNDGSIKELLNATLQQNDELSKMNRTLIQILRKDDDTTLDGKSIQKNIDHRMAMEMRW